jgi:hypothetical protein
MISIRLSEEEYTDLKQFALAKGARSVSDLARAAMNDLLEASYERRIGVQVDEVHSKISALDRKLDEISTTLASYIGRHP